MGDNIKMKRMRHGRNGMRQATASGFKYSNLGPRISRNIYHNKSPAAIYYNKKPSKPQQLNLNQYGIDKSVIKVNKYIKQDKQRDLIEIKGRINSKIADLKQKIDEQIKVRRKSIKENVKSIVCMKKDQSGFLRLKPSFIEYLINRSEKNMLQRYLHKKQLENLRFNQTSGEEDILLSKDGLISRYNKPKSLLDSDINEWEKWNSILEQIEKHAHAFKLNKKGNELNVLFEQYNDLTQERSKEDTIICEECGIKNPPQAIHCHYCGHKL